MSKPLGSKKTGGRKKGTPNNKTIGLEEALAKHNIDVVEQISHALPELPVEKRIEVLLNLMSYLFPKRKAVEVSGEVTSAANIKVEIEPVLNEQEERIQRERVKKIARTLMLLDETPKECYVRNKLEVEYDTIEKDS